MSKNNPANRSVGGHIKEGFKNIPTMYKGLYNRPMEGAKTVPTNLKIIATGKTSSMLDNKAPASTRAKLAAMGALSVTPAGPVAAFAMGVNKSVQQKAAAKAAARAAAVPKPPPAPPKLKLKTPAPTGAVPKAPVMAVKPGMPPKPGAPKIAATRTPKKA
jgi:hypothetical protein